MVTDVGIKQHQRQVNSKVNEIKEDIYFGNTLTLSPSIFKAEPGAFSTTVMYSVATVPSADTNPPLPEDAFYSTIQ